MYIDSWDASSPTNGCEANFNQRAPNRRNEASRLCTHQLRHCPVDPIQASSYTHMARDISIPRALRREKPWSFSPCVLLECDGIVVDGGGLGGDIILVVSTVVGSYIRYTPARVACVLLKDTTSTCPRQQPKKYQIPLAVASVRRPEKI